MRIPFASCGLKAQTGQTIYANLFRFRPPAATGWDLPAFGGYSPMPLGTFTLLPAESADKRTREVLPSSAASSPKVAASRTWSGKIGYYPLSGAITAEIHSGPHGQSVQGIFTVSGLGEKKLALGHDGRQLIVFDIPKGDQPVRQAELKIVDAGGKPLFESRRQLSAVKAPAWVGTKAGIAYVDQKIPRPWTMPKAERSAVRLVDKTLSFNALGLFQSIRDQQGEMLAGPTRIVVEKNGQPMAFEMPEVSVKPRKLHVEVSGRAKHGDAAVETWSLVDYDGFTVVKVRVRDVAPQKISRLAVRIPLKPSCAAFFHKSLVQEIGQLAGHGYETSSGPLWVGNQDKGIAFSFDTDPFLSRCLRKQMRIVENKDVTWLELNFVDGPGQITDDGHIFRFFLQPTPTKPVTLQKVHSRVRWQWEMWNDYMGYPDVAKAGKLTKWSDNLHKQGEIALLYACQGLAENAPGFPEFKEDLMAIPQWIFYRRGYDPGKDVPCYHCCKRGPEGDLQLWGFDKLSREAGIDGVVSDGLSLAWDCENPGHPFGCGRPANVAWESEPLSRVTAQREFLKRLRGIFNETGRPFYMAAHCGGGLDINTLSFFDGYMEGEQLSRFRKGYKIPLATFAVGYNGRPWGLRTIFWDYTWRTRKSLGVNWSLAYALLHDVEIEDGEFPNYYAGFENDDQTTYYPYWLSQPHITLRSDRSLVSYYLNKDCALVAVSNLDFAADRIQLDLTKLFPGHSLHVFELLSRKPVATENGVLACPLPGYQCLLLRVDKELPLAAASAPEAFVVNGFHQDDWLVNAGAPGVKVEHPASGGLVLRSAVYQAPATAELAKRSFGKNGTIALKLKIAGRFSLTVGPVALVHDAGAWQMSGPMDGWNDGAIYQVPPPSEKACDLVLTIHGGVFDAMLDGKTLLKKMRFDMSAGNNKISIRTWGGDSVTVDVEKVSCSPEALFEPGVSHPRL
jgi:hypothetical protein